VANRVAGEVALPGPHTTRRTGSAFARGYGPTEPYRAVPEGQDCTKLPLRAVSVSPDANRHCPARPYGVIAGVRLTRLTVRPLSLVLRACVRPSGPFGSGSGLRLPTPGSLPALLRPRLTPRHGRRRCRRRFRPAARSARDEVSPSKRVSFPGTTPCFTCGSESGTSLCGANSSVPPASEHISVRGLAVLTPASSRPGLATAPLPSSNAWILDSCIEDLADVTSFGTPRRSLTCRAYTNMHGSEPGLCVLAAIHASRGPGR
jgi:hypothetical protein